MSVVNPNVRFTYEDYQSLSESMEKRYELLDGDLMMVPAPTTMHQRASRNLEFLLIQFVRHHKLGEVFDAPVDVVLGEGKNREIVQPDLIFVSHERKGIVTKKEIRGAPDLIVEILSPGTEERDRGYKKALYARYGVREYWIVNPDEQVIEVYVPQAQGFHLAEAYRSPSRRISAMLPTFEIELDEVFQAR
ncbi:MAG: Uma2 family endonuclease [Gammaproteobacteria bacterium]|nr:Uma2 family endonuclease [Gammaproteobacteria bacterium]MBA3731987.1 Uma2 family endonuclease [Gammaproteobacteria bacterium]